MLHSAASNYQTVVLLNKEQPRSSNHSGLWAGCFKHCRRVLQRLLARWCQEVQPWPRLGLVAGAGTVVRAEGLRGLRHTSWWERLAGGDCHPSAPHLAALLLTSGDPGAVIPRCAGLRRANAEPPGPQGASCFACAVIQQHEAITSDG